MNIKRFSLGLASFLPGVLALLSLDPPVAWSQTAPFITQQPNSLTNVTGATVTLTVAVSGDGPLTYQWQLNGVNLSNNIISTVAGGGASGYFGDGGLATDAWLDQPYGVVVDASGNIFIADTQNQRVREVGTNGIISTLAGDGSSSFSGDGGAAGYASLSGPMGLALDASGNLFIADATNNRVRMVDINGIITTVAGGGAGFIGGPATNTSLAHPDAVAVDASGDLFIANFGINHVYKVDANGILTSMAGGSISGGYSGDGVPANHAPLHGPTGVAVDASGNVFIADQLNNRVRIVDTNGIITTVAGNGRAGYSGDGAVATNASLHNPSGVAVDAFGNLFIADSGNNVIRQVGGNGVITTVAGNFASPGYSGDGGAATAASLASPTGVALDGSGNLYIADEMNNRIRFLALGGLPTLTLADLTAPMGGDYQVVIAGPYGSVTSAVATLTVLSPPLIVTQPSGVATAAGSAANLRVDVSGAQPFSYQWYFNGTNAVPGGTNSSLFLANPGVSDSGDYTVVVNNSDGSVTSSVAALLVGIPPTITNQPANQAVAEGDSVTFNVAPTGTGPFTFQWLLNGTALPNDVIATVAGGWVGDGSPATNADLNHPTSVAVDSSGSLFIADYYNNRVRKVDTNGIIITVSGNGTRSYSGDGGMATNASLNYPSGVVVDGSGNLYIGDSGNNRIRKVDTNGVITTVAGNGLAGYSGDKGAATKASLDFSYGPWTAMALDATGNLFIADFNNSVIRKVDTKGIITTAAGTPSFIGYAGDGGPATAATFNGLMGLAVDASGDLFIADYNNLVIREVDTKGIITTVAGTGNYYDSGDGGAATNANLSNPLGIVVDASGNLYIADFNSQFIRRVDTNGIITTVAGNGAGRYFGDGTNATNASLYSPAGLALDASGNLFIADFDNNRVRKIDASGIITSVAGNGSGGYFGDGGAATAAGLFLPSGVTVDSSGNLFIADFDNNRVRQVDTNGIITTVAGNGFDRFPGDGILAQLVSGGGPVYSGDAEAATKALLWSPAGVGVDGLGELFIADESNQRIRKVDTSGIITTVAGGGPHLGFHFAGDGGPATNAVLSAAAGVALDGFGDLFIADYYNNRIRKVDTNGIITTVAGHGATSLNSGSFSGDGGPATNANLNLPTGVATDALGDLLIADFQNNRIRKVDVHGIISTVAGNGSFAYSGDGGAAVKAALKSPEGVALDTSGNLFIADSQNHRVRKVDTNGIISTVAGNGTAGVFGDGGAGTNANLNVPIGVAVDAFGNLFIADSYNNRIREVFLGGLPSLTVSYVSAANAGKYQVVATSPYGSVTGLVANLTVVPSTNQMAGIVMSVPVIMGGNLLLGFNLTQGVSASLTLLQTPTLAGPWTTNTSAALTTNVQTGGFQFSVPTPKAIEFYQVRSP